MGRTFLFATFTLMFFANCGFINISHPKPKKPKLHTNLAKEYYKILQAKCNITIKDALEYEYYLTGNEKYLRELGRLPNKCKNLSISKNTFLVSSLEEKEESCFPGIEFKKGREKLKKTLEKRINEVLSENFCY